MKKNNELARLILSALSNNVFKYKDFETYIYNYVNGNWNTHKIRTLLKEYREYDLVRYIGNGNYYITGKLFN